MADDPLNDRPEDDPIQDLSDRTEDVLATVRANKRELDERITETTELLEESQRLLRSVGEPDAK